MFEELETGNPEVPLYFGEGLRRSLGNAAGCGGAETFLAGYNPWGRRESGMTD